MRKLIDERSNILNIYCTAGYPKLNDTVPVMIALQEAGADMIELGMPYSDPLADGPVIQESSATAIANGMNIAVLFKQLENFRSHVNVPVILMGYLNPVLQYGFEKFCEDASKAGIDGLIIPDLPAEEFETRYKDVCDRYELNFIFLVTPSTPGHRIRMLDKLSSGFLYAVSSSSTTGNTTDTHEMEKYLQRLSSLALRNPILVGFGISNKNSFDVACKYAKGAVIGSAYIKAIKGTHDIAGSTKEFIERLRE